MQEFALTFSNILEKLAQFQKVFDELKRLMLIHGGTFHHYQSNKTTHIIAKNLPDVSNLKLHGEHLDR